MKKLILILALFSFASANAQVFQSQHSFGFEYKRLKIDSTLHIPTFCGVPTLGGSVIGNQGALAIDSCNKKLYFYDPKDSTWSIIASGGNDSASYHTLTRIDDTTYTINRPNGSKDTLRISVSLNHKTDTIQNIASLQAYTGIANSLICIDTLQGGVFYRSSTGIVDNGVTFQGVGCYWIRQFDKSKGANPDWWGQRNDVSINKAIAANKTVNFTAGAIYTLSNQLNPVSGQIFYGNGATLKRANDSVVTLTSAVLATDSSFTVTGIPSNWKTVSWLYQFFSDTTNTNQNVTVNTSTSITGNTVKLGGTIGKAWGIGTKVRRVFNMIQGVPNIKMYDLNFDGNMANNNANYSWQANSTIFARGYGDVVIDHCKFNNIPNANIVGQGLIVTNSTANDLNGSFIHLTTEANTLPVTKPSIISGNVTDSTNLQLVANGHAEGAITNSFTPGFVTIVNNRFSHGGLAGVFGYMQSDSNAADGAYRDVVINGNYAEGFSHIFYYLSILPSLNRNGHIFINGNEFNNCGINDWSSFKDSINKYVDTMMIGTNMLVGGTTWTIPVENSDTLQRFVLNNSTSTPQPATVNITGNGQFGGFGQFGNTVTGRQFASTYSNDYSSPGYWMKGVRPNMRYDLVDSTIGGLFAYDFQQFYVTNKTNYSKLLGSIGIYGNEHLGGAPTVNYLYIGADSNSNYLNNNIEFYPDKTVALMKVNDLIGNILTIQGNGTVSYRTASELFNDIGANIFYSNSRGDTLLNAVQTKSNEFFNSSYTGTSFTYSKWQNAGGQFYIGQESSIPGFFYTGSSAYANILYGSRPFQFIYGGVKQFEVNGSGAALFTASDGSGSFLTRNASTSQLQTRTAAEVLTDIGAEPAFPIDTVTTVTSLINYPNKAKIIYLSDTLQGGLFYYSQAANVQDSGIVFNATGRGSGYWIRSYDKSRGVSADWWGTRNDINIGKAVIAGKIVNLTPGAIYTLSNQINLKGGQIFNGNGAWLKRANDSIVTLTAAVLATDSSFTVTGIPSSWYKGAQGLQQFFSDSTDANENVTLYGVVSISGTTVKLSGPIGRAWPIGTKVRRIFGMIRAVPDSKIYNTNFDGNYANTSSNLSIKANPTIVGNGYGDIIIDHCSFLNIPNETIQGQGLVVTNNRATNTNGSFVYLLADNTANPTYRPSIITSNYTNNTNLQFAKSGNAAGVIAHGFSPGYTTISNNRFLNGNGAAVFGYIQSDSSASDGAYRDVVINGNYAEGFSHIFYYLSILPSLNRNGHVFINGNTFSNCGTTDWTAYKDSIDKYVDTFMIGNNALVGGTVWKIPIQKSDTTQRYILNNPTGFPQPAQINITGAGTFGQKSGYNFSPVFTAADSLKFATKGYVDSSGTTLKFQAPIKYDATDSTVKLDTANMPGLRPYKVYTAILTQSGTNAPTATVLENTTGYTFTYTYDNVGWYTLTCSGNIFSTPRHVYVVTQNEGWTPMALFEYDDDTINSITLHVRKTSDESSVNDSMNGATIEIRIY